MSEDIILDEHEFENMPAKKKRKPQYVIWGVFTFVAFLFKVMHWPGGSLFLVIGTGGLLGYSVYDLIICKGKSVAGILFTLLGLLWILNLLYQNISREGHPLNFHGMLIMGAIFLFVFVINFAFGRKRFL